MSQLVFTVFKINEDIEVYGLRQKSNDKTQSKDIPSLSKKYYAVAEKGRGEDHQRLFNDERAWS